MLLAVHLFDVTHQCPVRPRVRVARRIAECGEQLDALPVVNLNSQEAPVIILDPIGSVAGEAVLPAPKPQEYQLEVVAPGLLDKPIHQGKFELALGGLHLCPRYGSQHAVEIARNQLGPDGLHILQAGSSVVSQLTRQRQERLSIHDQLCGAALLLQMRDGRDCLSVALDRDRQGACGQSPQRNLRVHFSFTPTWGRPPTCPVLWRAGR